MVMCMVSKGVVKSMKVVRFVLERGFYEEVPKDLVKAAIVMEIGSHPVTISQYLNVLEVTGMLKKFTMSTYKIDLDRVQEFLRLLEKEGIENKDITVIKELIRQHLLGGEEQ